MKLLIDLQGCQSESRHRGIGRYSRALVQALVETAQGDEIHLLLNGQLHESIDELRSAFEQQLGPGRFHVFDSPRAVRQANPGSAQLRIAAEVMREHVIAQVAPDGVLVCSLFEGFGDDTVTSIGRTPSRVPTAVVLYDLIPLLNPAQYLSQPLLRDWYYRKLDHLRRADLLLAISDSTAAEATRHLGFPAGRMVNISGSFDSRFSPAPVTPEQQVHLAARWHLNRPFVLYTSGGDTRKNNEGLIAAWARLDPSLRAKHQLVIVSSSLAQPLIDALMATAERVGLARGDLVVVAGCSDDELVLLYRACRLFVFPSFHEGFGLPLVEAMACGRAVLSSDTSSLPEVMNRADALFDPYDASAMAERIGAVLNSDALRGELEAHALQRAATYSWQHGAERAWRVLRSISRTNAPARQRLLYMPLPAAAPAAALELEAAFVPDWARHFQMDFLSDARGVIGEWSFGAWRDRAWVQEHGHGYDQVVAMLLPGEPPAILAELMDQWPGHLLLLGPETLRLPMRADTLEAAAGRRAIVLQRGWQALHTALAADEPFDARPAATLIERARSITALGWDSPSHVRIDPPVGFPPRRRRAARAELGLGTEEIVICLPQVFAADDVRALACCRALLQALLQGARARVVALGRGPDMPYLRELQRELPGSVVVTGHADAGVQAAWLDAADFTLVVPDARLPAALQRYEVARHMAQDTLVITPLVLAPGDPLREGLLAVPIGGDELSASPTQALPELLQDAAKRQAMQVRAHAALASHAALREMTDALSQRWRTALPPSGIQTATDDIALVAPGLDDSARLTMARALVRNFPPVGRRPQLLVDVSELAQRDARSGIQRVVRAVLLEMLRLPDRGYDIQPVYATTTEPYRYARRFASDFIGAPADWTDDDWVEAWPGDVFFGLDFQTHVVLSQAELLREWRRRGVRVHFMVYDLLPIKQPQFFADGARAMHHRWLELLSEGSGTISISRTVADEYASWLDAFGAERRTAHRIDWAHIGADVENSAPSKGLPKNADALLDALRQHPTWLMVGTIEPRKAHEQTLKAFELLWDEGFQGNLVIVGKVGWHVEELVSTLTRHPQSGRQLFWLRDASDEFLETLYAQASCLIAASFGEGFGLPLIEAAQHATPLICRDIPVFREVADEHATYFPDVDDPEAIADAVRRFHADFAQGCHRSSAHIAWSSWQQCAQRILDQLLGAAPYRSWVTPRQRSRWGNDVQASSDVGVVDGEDMVTQGQAGWLYLGPPRRMPSGRLTVEWDLRCLYLAGTERVELVAQGGSTVLGASRVGSSPERPARASLEITLPVACPDLQARLWVDAETDMALHRIRFIEGG